MSKQPEYKSVKIPFTSWQALTRICAETGEPRTKALERIIKDAEAIGHSIRDHDATVAGSPYFKERYDVHN